VAVRLPLFWAERPAVWFAQAEAQFTLAVISSENTVFFQLMSQLDHRYAAEVDDIITSSLEREPYTTQAVPFTEAPQEPYSRRVGRLSPKHLVQPATLQRTDHSRRSGRGILDVTARCADRISEVAPQPVLASVNPPPDKTALLQGIEELSRLVAALSAELKRLRLTFRYPILSSRDPCLSTSQLRPGSRNRPLSSRHPSRGNTAPRFCWYHRCFGALAQKCTPPCA
jgi:hypothetical protein